MDDLKLFSKSESQIETLVGTVQIFSTDIGMCVLSYLYVCYVPLTFYSLNTGHPK